MENNDKIIMSKIAFERMQAKEEKENKWKNIIIVLLISLLVLSNGMWLYAWLQYDYTDEVTEIHASQDGNGVNIAGGGDINYGTGSNDQAQGTQQGA